MALSASWSRKDIKRQERFLARLRASLRRARIGLVPLAYTLAEAAKRLGGRARLDELLAEGMPLGLRLTEVGGVEVVTIGQVERVLERERVKQERRAAHRW